jgi:hypothetical protein
MLAVGNPPQATVMSGNAVIVGKVAGLIVIILDTVLIVLPQRSFAVHVSVTVPPQAPGTVLKVLAFEVPLIRQPPLNALLKGIVLGVRVVPQLTVIGAKAVIVGTAGGFTVITCDAVDVIPHESVAVHVRVMA